MIFGINKDEIGVGHVAAPTTYMGDLIPQEKQYPFAVQASAACNKHEFGTALKIGGVWAWRGHNADLVPCDSHDHC